MSDAMRRLARGIRSEVGRSRPQFLPATIVGAVSGRDGYSQVTLPNGDTLEVLNQRVSNIANLQVLLGEDPLLPNVLQVMGVQERFEAGTGFGIMDHHRRHEYPSEDTVWVQAAQILPLNVLPNGGFEVQVYGSLMYVDGGWVKVDAQTLDLSASQPASGARYVLIEADGTGALSVVDGSTVAAKGSLVVTDIPTPSAGSFPIAAIALYAGQSEISRDTRAGGLNDFVEDMRFSGFAWSGGAGYDLGAEIHAASASAVSDSDEFPFWEDTSTLLKKITWANIKATLALLFQPLANILTELAGLANSAGALTNDGAGNLSWVETGSGVVYDTEANILASTETEGTFGVASDENVNGHHNVFVSLGAGSWMKLPFAAIPVTGARDAGLSTVENNLLGYGRDYISNKSLNNVTLGGNAVSGEGGIWIDYEADPPILYLRLSGANNTILYDLSLVTGQLVHYPFSSTEPVQVRSGNSVELGWNGLPLVQEYQRDAGCFPAARIIDGGSA